MPNPIEFTAVSNRIRVVVLLLLTMHAALLAYSATRHSPTLNEPGHLLAGLANWRFGRFELYRVNPPLVKMIAAVPVMAVGYEANWHNYDDSPGARPIFSMGPDFMVANQERSLWLCTLARWACIPISVAGGLFCFLWSREFWNSQAAGVVSLTLWCFDPNILAHGELITPDCAAASFGLGATWLFWRWLRQPSWDRAIFAGVLLGIAQLSKMTWIILFGLWPTLWILWCVLSNRRLKTAFRCCRQQAVQFVVILLIGLYLLNLGYGFDETGTRLKDFTFVSNVLTGAETSGQTGNRFADTWLGELPVPVPKQYLLGMDVQRRDFEDYGQKSFLNGEWKEGGWWYYYLFGMAYKTPHGTQALVLAAALLLTVGWFRSRRNCVAKTNVKAGQTVTCDASASDEFRPLIPGTKVRRRDLMILLAPAVVVFALVSSHREFNHHLRYVLPVFGFVFVLAGVLGRVFHRSESSFAWDRARWASGLAGCGIAAGILFTIVSVLSVYPHQIAYFNELSGGPVNGYQRMAHSNVDWGQDLLLVREWMQQHRIARDDVHFVSYYQYPAARIIGPDKMTPSTSARYQIVSANRVTDETLPWAERLKQEPIQRIGYSLWVFPVWRQQPDL